MEENPGARDGDLGSCQVREVPWWSLPRPAWSGISVPRGDRRRDTGGRACLLDRSGVTQPWKWHSSQYGADFGHTFTHTAITTSSSLAEIPYVRSSQYWCDGSVRAHEPIRKCRASSWGERVDGDLDLCDTYEGVSRVAVIDGGGAVPGRGRNVCAKY